MKFEMTNPLTGERFLMNSSEWTGKTQQGQPIQYINDQLFYCMKAFA